MREEGKLDLGSSSEDNFHDGLGVPPAATAELVGNAHSSRWDRSPISVFYRPVQREANQKFVLFQVDECVREPAGRHRSR